MSVVDKEGNILSMSEVLKKLAARTAKPPPPFPGAPAGGAGASPPPPPPPKLDVTPETCVLKLSGKRSYLVLLDAPLIEGPLQPALRSGELLCDLINVLKPGSQFN